MIFQVEDYATGRGARKGHLMSFILLAVQLRFIQCNLSKFRMLMGVQTFCLQSCS